MSKELINVATTATTLIPESNKLLKACNTAYEQKYKDLVISSKEDDQTVNEAIVKIRAIAADAEGKRKAITTKFDAVKKDLMIPEKGFKVILEALTGKRNIYANEQLKATRQRENSLQIEADKKAESNKLPLLITANVDRLITEKVNAIIHYMDNQTALCIDVSLVDKLIVSTNDKIKTIELKETDYNDCFFAEYNYLSIDEYNAIIKACKVDKYSFESVKSVYVDNAKTELESFVKLLNNKRVKLLDISKMKDDTAKEQAIEKEKAEQETLKVEREQKAKEDQVTKEKELNNLQAKADLDAQMSATVATLNGRDAVTGKGTRITYEAVVNNPAAYPSIISEWIETYALDDKKMTQFAKAMNTFVQDLAKGDQPNIDGIEYVEVAKTMAR